MANRKGEYGRYSFYAQRDDYLRIGLMVMNHWNNDTCVGKYLKTMYEKELIKINKVQIHSPHLNIPIVMVVNFILILLDFKIKKY